MNIQIQTEPTVFVVTSNDGWKAQAGDAAIICGMRVVSVPALSMFLDAAAKLRGPACVFIDVDAADVDWSKLYQLMLDKNLEIPVIAVAEEAVLTDAIEAVKSCANFVISRPADVGLIREAIEAAMTSRKIIGHHFAVERNHRRLLTLDDRERSIVDLAVDGAPNKQIANRLGLSVKTIERIRKNAYRKLDVRSTAEMTRAVILGGLHDIVKATAPVLPSALGLGGRHMAETANR